MIRKVIFFMSNIFIFSLVYFMLGDYNFSGINIIEETLRQEILRKNLTSQIKENLEIDVDVLQEKEKKIVEKETKEVKSQIRDEELDKLSPSKIQQYFDRLYFSMVTGTTLGYGDIYPRTNLCRFLTMIQLLATIVIVFFLK